ncbi:uncharacterized protein LOC122672179 [Telopea speciosissima]|uniref:uncharacterized protein LOC122672179 n=1 Tax=Telopea speciosissima TaxID=54955 RepID=UPI001CC49DFB|nr:uncharacterized protein LOC122672179 [Telopea speciosissima]
MARRKTAPSTNNAVRERNQSPPPESSRRRATDPVSQEREVLENQQVGGVNLNPEAAIEGPVELVPDPNAPATVGQVNDLQRQILDDQQLFLEYLRQKTVTHHRRQEQRQEQSPKRSLPKGVTRQSGELSQHPRGMADLPARSDRGRTPSHRSIVPNLEGSIRRSVFDGRLEGSHVPERSQTYCEGSPLRSRQDSSRRDPSPSRQQSRQEGTSRRGRERARSERLVRREGQTQDEELDKRLQELDEKLEGGMLSTQDRDRKPCESRESEQVREGET